MPRIPRQVVPGYPHHVIQRGNRRQKTFFHAEDYLAHVARAFVARTFSLFVMDEPHLDPTVRYVEFNPVSAKLCERPQDWRWSSVHAHVNSSDDRLVTIKPMLEKFPDWATYLEDRQSNEVLLKVRKHTETGRPLGSTMFIKTLESLSGRSLNPLKPGRRTAK
jgi:putative transposase